MWHGKGGCSQFNCGESDIEFPEESSEQEEEGEEET